MPTIHFCCSKSEDKYSIPLLPSISSLFMFQQIHDQSIIHSEYHSSLTSFDIVHNPNYCWFTTTIQFSILIPYEYSTKEELTHCIHTQFEEIKQKSMIDSSSLFFLPSCIINLFLLIHRSSLKTSTTILRVFLFLSASFIHSNE